MTQVEKKKPIIEILPTFLLRSVDPAKVIADYQNGKYQNLSMHNKVENQPTLNQRLPSISLLPDYDKSADSESYSYVDKSNVQRIVGTTNHRNYEIIKANTQLAGALPFGNGEKCNWCRVELTQSPIGIPIKIQCLKTKDASQGENKYYVFHCEGSYCSFECCYAGLKQLNQPIFVTRDSLHMESEQMLRFMYDIIYPNSKLQEAPDWRILKDNGGFLSREEFFSCNHTFHRLPSIILLPAKVEYARKG